MLVYSTKANINTNTELERRSKARQGKVGIYRFEHAIVKRSPPPCQSSLSYGSDLVQPNSLSGLDIYLGI